MNYKFFGWEQKDVTPIDQSFKAIKNQRDLYDKLDAIWCEYSCAPRLREKWRTSHKTLGQCSITSFLIQDIFGGEVYGVPLEGGGYHCYNVVGDVRFDLTSEQFDSELVYEDKYLQTREQHFADKEKFERYSYLKNELLKALK